MAAPRKILQFIDSFDPGGAESMLMNLCLGLRERGMEITVGHFGNPWLTERCRDEEIPQAIIGKHHWYKSSFTLPAFAIAFARYLRKNKFDVVHAHLFGATIAAAAAGRISGTGVVATLHDSYTLTERPTRIRLLQLAAMSGVQLVSVAQYMEDLFRSMGHFNPHAWRTIHNGVDTQFFHPLPAGHNKIAARTSLGLPGNCLLIGSVGRLVKLKRFAQLIEVFCKLEVDAHLIIIGDGPERPHLTALINQLGATDRVHLLGQRRDVEQLLPLFDLFTLWSETEGLSCSVAEAMSCGLPVLVSDVGGNHELVKNGESGYLIPTAAPNGLSLHLQNLANDTSLRQRLGNSARLKIQIQFSLDVMIDTYTALLNSNQANN